jgi:hypothetical protein
VVPVGFLPGRGYLEGGIQKVSFLLVLRKFGVASADMFDIKVAGCLEVQRMVKFFGYVYREGHSSFIGQRERLLRDIALMVIVEKSFRPIKCFMLYLLYPNINSSNMILKPANIKVFQ